MLPFLLLAYVVLVVLVVAWCRAAAIGDRAQVDPPSPADRLRIAA